MSGTVRVVEPDFNPRSREGSDVLTKLLTAKHADFNPRSREGSDGLDYIPALPDGHFNPRSREGSDWTELKTLSQAQISIHAPAKGATIEKLRKNTKKCYFNPRSREGSDI